MTNYDLPPVELDPPEDTITRNLVVLLVDSSGSMNEKVPSGNVGRKQTKITALQAALTQFIERDVHDEPKLEANGEIALIAFGDKSPRVLSLGTAVLPGSPFHFVRHIHQPPKLVANGLTPMAAAIDMGLDAIKERKASLASSGITHEFRPNLFLLTDGEATDGSAALDSVARRVHAEEAAKGVLFWALGTADANEKQLKSIADKDNYLPLPGNSIAQFLKFVSRSFRTQGAHGSANRDASEIYSAVSHDSSYDDEIDALIAEQHKRPS